MSHVARGVQEVQVPRLGFRWNEYVWVWQAFLQNGSGSVFCNHRHRTAKGAEECSRRMAKAGGHPLLTGPTS